ncbi:MAG TPA: hypothetical protein VGC97_14790 [Pyrinomonadaceae bacterium]|jgi:hypothetical protein
MPEETYETTPEYRGNYEILLELIGRRKEMLRLLKTAQPENVSKVRKAISDIDESIERTEEIMALEREIFLKSRKAENDLLDLVELAEKIEPELRAYLAKHHPEKLELHDAFMSDEALDKN